MNNDPQVISQDGKTWQNATRTSNMRVDTVHLNDRIFDVSSSAVMSGGYETVVFEIDSQSITIGNSETLAKWYYGGVEGQHFNVLNDVLAGNIPHINYYKKETKPVIEYRQILPFTHTEYGKLEEMVAGWIDTFDDAIRNPLTGKLPTDENLMVKYKFAIRMRNKIEQHYLSTCDYVASCVYCRMLFPTHGMPADMCQGCGHCWSAVDMGYCAERKEANGNWCLKCEHVQDNGLNVESDGDKALAELRRKLAAS